MSQDQQAQWQGWNLPRQWKELLSCAGSASVGSGSVTHLCVTWWVISSLCVSEETIHYLQIIQTSQLFLQRAERERSMIMPGGRVGVPLSLELLPPDCEVENTPTKA